MAMSGVELEAECKTVYDEVQSKKKHRYVTFMIADGKIKVDKVIKRMSQNCLVLFLVEIGSFKVSDFNPWVFYYSWLSWVEFWS